MIKLNMTLKESSHKLAIIAIILAAIVGGGIPVFTKIGLKTITPLNFLFLRFFIASLFMLLILLKKERIKFDKQIFKVMLLSLLATANVIFFTFGVRLTTATISQMLYAAVPIIAGAFSFFLLKERLSLNKSSGIIIGFIGIAIIILLPVIGKASPFKGSLGGNILIFTGVVCFSLYTVFSKKMQKYYSPTFLTTVFSLTTAFVLFFISLSDFTLQSLWLDPLPTEALFSVLYVGILGTAGYYILYQYALKHGTPIIASMTMYLQPIGTFCWALVLLGEHLTGGFVIGATLAITGALLVTYSITTVNKQK